MTKLLIATTNAGKFKEIEAYFQNLQVECISLRTFPNAPEVIEDRDTFMGNAEKKAKELCEFSNLLTLADDSGLEIDALDGRPGVYSARYAGPNATDKDNNEKLLEELKTTPQEKRTARFQCAMVLCHPDEKTDAAIGTVEGEILTEPKGDLGFGYDPLFYIPAIKKTLAELPLDEKGKISHRAKALKQIKNSALLM